MRGDLDSKVRLVAGVGEQRWGGERSQGQKVAENIKLLE